MRAIRTNLFPLCGLANLIFNSEKRAPAYIGNKFELEKCSYIWIVCVCVSVWRTDGRTDFFCRTIQLRVVWFECHWIHICNLYRYMLCYRAHNISFTIDRRTTHFCLVWFFNCGRSESNNKQSELRAHAVRWLLNLPHHARSTCGSILVKTRAYIQSLHSSIFD